MGTVVTSGKGKKIRWGYGRLYFPKVATPVCLPSHILFLQSEVDNPASREKGSLFLNQGGLPSTNRMQRNDA